MKLQTKLYTRYGIVCAKKHECYLESSGQILRVRVKHGGQKLISLQCNGTTEVEPVPGSNTSLYFRPLK